MTDKVINSSLVYDTRRRVMLLVDGTTIGGDTVTRPMRVWRWTRDAWQLVDSAGPRRVGFSNVAFDDARGVLVASDLPERLRRSCATPGDLDSGRAWPASVERAVI